MIYRIDSKEKNLRIGSTQNLEASIRILGPKSTQFYKYYEALMVCMMKKTENYDFACIQKLFEGVGMFSYHLLDQKVN